MLSIWMARISPTRIYPWGPARFTAGALAAYVERQGKGRGGGFHLLCWKPTAHILEISGDLNGGGCSGKGRYVGSPC